MDFGFLKVFVSGLSNVMSILCPIKLELNLLNLVYFGVNND